MARLHSPGRSIRKASRDAAEALAAAQVEGFLGLTDRVREAVVSSERLVQLLDQVAREGFSPTGAREPLPADEVLAATSVVRGTIGAIAMSTPSQFSTHFNAYTARVGELVALAQCVAAHGIEDPAPKADEWQPFL